MISTQGSRNERDNPLIWSTGELLARRLLLAVLCHLIRHFLRLSAGRKQPIADIHEDWTTRFSSFLSPNKVWVRRVAHRGISVLCLTKRKRIRITSYPCSEEFDNERNGGAMLRRRRQTRLRHDEVGFAVANAMNCDQRLVFRNRQPT